MSLYVGLTGDLERRRLEHGSPHDWRACGPLPSEFEARAWERRMLSLPGSIGGPGGSGWRHGYTYTVTPGTVESMEP